MSTLDQAMDYLADRVHIGEYSLTSQNKSVSAKTTTTIQTKTIQPGKWLVLSFMDLGSSLTGVYNHTLDGQVVRSTETSGGGSVNFRILNESSARSISLTCYVSAACTVRTKLVVIRLAP